MAQDDRDPDEIVLRDGTVMIRTWHGAKVHEETGVRGGLTGFYGPSVGEIAPEQPKGSIAAISDDAEGVEVHCAFCRTPRRLAAWQARRFTFCNRSCALKHRHAAAGQ